MKKILTPVSEGFIDGIRLGRDLLVVPVRELVRVAKVFVGDTATDQPGELNKKVRLYRSFARKRSRSDKKKGRTRRA